MGVTKNDLFYRWALCPHGHVWRGNHHLINLRWFAMPAGVGSVATQNITDPHLATLVLDAMQAGQDAETAIKTVTRDCKNISYRQLTAVDAKGTTAHFTGIHILGTHAVSQAADCVAVGNLLSSSGVANGISEGFCVDPSAHLAERLLQAIEGGVAAGGEEGPVRSAALLVGHEMPFPLVDLRVDWDDDDPIVSLRRPWGDYQPQMNDYLNRAINPQEAPSYGVAGDP